MIKKIVDLDDTEDEDGNFSEEATSGYVNQD